jgi:hypothetical protein
MARKFITIELQGEDKIQAGLRMQEARQELNLRELVDDLAEAAEATLIAVAPRSSNYILEHIAREGPVFMPGGPGGGGEWKAIVGVKEGTSRHPIYVDQGTGIYAGREIIIRPVGVMPITKKFGEVGPGGVTKTKFRWYVRGQPGQHYFYLTWRALNALAASRIAAKRLL